MKWSRLACDIALLSALSCARGDHPGATTRTTAATPGSSVLLESSELPRAPRAELAVRYETPELARPEAVIHDPRGDVYLVSSRRPVSFIPWQGFVSRLAPDGRVLALRWIEGGKDGVTLREPRGLALSSELLFVADLDTVRTFDPVTGAPRAQIEIPGARELTDVSIAPDGRVFVSDEAGDKLFAITPSLEVSVVAHEGLGGPRALLATKDAVWIASASGDLLTLDPRGRRIHAERLPAPSLDGIATTGRDLLVASALGSSVLRSSDGGFHVVIGSLRMPTDIGYDAKRGRVLVPLSSASTVEAYRLVAPM